MLKKSVPSKMSTKKRVKKYRNPEVGVFRLLRSNRRFPHLQLVQIYSPGDSHCFFHSVLNAVDRMYRQYNFPYEMQCVSPREINEIFLRSPSAVTESELITAQGDQETNNTQNDKLQKNAGKRPRLTQRQTPRGPAPGASADDEETLIDRYLQKQRSARKRHAVALRTALADYLEVPIPGTKVNVYQALGRGKFALEQEELKVAGQGNEKAYTLPVLLRHLKSQAYVGQEVIEMTEHFFGINIYIMNRKTGDLYHMGDNDLFYRKDRPNIVIMYNGKNHYDLVGVLLPDQSIETFFAPSHKFSRMLYERIKNTGTPGK